MNPETILIEHPTLSDYPRIRQIATLSFKDVAKRPAAVKRMHEERWYKPRNLFVARVRGDIVSVLGIREGTLWIEGVAFPAGMLGTVCTHPDRRGRGIGGALVQRAIRYMTDARVAISYLHTIPERFGFYGRLGFVRAEMPRSHVVADASALAGSGPAHAERPSGPRVISKLNALYEGHFGRLTGGWSRDEEFWRARLAGLPNIWFPAPYAFYLDDARRPSAYAVVEPGEKSWAVLELAGDERAPEPVLSVLRHIAGEASAAGAGSLVIDVSERDPLFPVLVHVGEPREERTSNVFLAAQDTRRFLPLAERVLTARARRAGTRIALTPTDRGIGIEIDQGKLAIEWNALAALMYNGTGCGAGPQAGVPPPEWLLPATHPRRSPLDRY